jgi:ABC-type uncharacterized transport system fused permease/ATPase subunit
MHARFPLLRRGGKRYEHGRESLDPKSQVKLMKLITDQPEMTVLSIGHRPELEHFTRARWSSHDAARAPS